jgi:hypothetical protein
MSHLYNEMYGPPVGLLRHLCDGAAVIQPTKKRDPCAHKKWSAEVLHAVLQNVSGLVPWISVLSMISVPRCILLLSVHDATLKYEVACRRAHNIIKMIIVRPDLAQIVAARAQLRLERGLFGGDYTVVIVAAVFSLLLSLLLLLSLPI